MKIFFLNFLFFSISIAQLFSQTEPRLEWGPNEKGSPSSYNRFIIKGNADYTALSFISSNRVELIKYDVVGLQYRKTEPLIGKSKTGVSPITKDYQYEDIVSLTNKTVLFVRRYDKSSKSNSLYTQEISQDGRTVGSLKKISEIHAEKKRDQGSFEMVVSDDSTKILLVNNPPYKKYNNEKFEYIVLDNNLNELHHLAVELPYRDKYFSVSNYIMGDDGKIFMLARIEEKTKDDEEPQADYYYELITIDPNENGKVMEYEIKLPEKYIADASFNLDINDNIICAGFYGNLKRNGREKDGLQGIFYMRINSGTKEVEAKGIKEFDKEVVAKISGEKAANKGRGITSTFKLKQFIPKSDGGVVLIGEIAYIYTTQNCTYSYGPNGRSTQTCTTTTHYVNNEIIAFNVNKEGTIKWCVTIPKQQHTTNDGGIYNSYALYTSGDKMYFIYNDSRWKEATKEKKAMAYNTARLITLNEAGETKKGWLAGEKSTDNFKLMMKNYKQFGDNEFVFYTFTPAISRCCGLITKVPSKNRLLRVTF